MPALRFFAALSVGLAVGVLVMAVTAMAGKASDGDERQYHAGELRGGTALSCNDDEEKPDRIRDEIATAHEQEACRKNGLGQSQVSPSPISR